MVLDGILQFDETGRLYINHHCETCEKFPLENLNEPCLQCGYSQRTLISLEKYVNRANKALDLFVNVDDEDIDVREAFVQLSLVKLGQGLDQAVLTDVNITDDIRNLADLAEHMVRVIIYPTNIRHIEGDYWIFEEVADDDEQT